MRGYRAEQIVKWKEIQFRRLRGGFRRKVYKLMWKKRRRKGMVDKE